MSKYGKYDAKFPTEVKKKTKKKQGTCQVILSSKCIAKHVWKEFFFFFALEQGPASQSSFSTHFSFINPNSVMSAKPAAFNDLLLTTQSPESIIRFDTVYI